MQLEIHQR